MSTGEHLLPTRKGDAHEERAAMTAMFGGGDGGHDQSSRGRLGGEGACESVEIQFAKEAEKGSYLS